MRGFSASSGGANRSSGARAARRAVAFLVAVIATFAVTFSPLIAQADPDPDSQNWGGTPNTSGPKIAPLVVIFDTSGSMDAEDAGGTRKIDAAKHSINQLLRSWSTNGRHPLGLWTYPGGDSSCSPGGWVPEMKPEQNPDATTLSAQIDLLEPHGDTPTAEALEAVVDSLKAQGYTSATLLLVSDGESTCAPPCDVAKSIAASGFDIQIPTAGFEISDSGEEELKCIASATNAHYTRVDNAEQLGDLLDEYQASELELQVQAPEVIRSGGNAIITATITNPSKDTMLEVKANLFMEHGMSREIFQSIVAPQRYLGALGPGQSTQVSWIATGGIGKSGLAVWTVLVGAPGEGAVLESGTIEVRDSALGLAQAGGVLRGVTGPIVVLGDSFSSGEGAKDYLEQGDVACHRTQNAYGGVLAGGKAEIIACSGAVSPHITSNSQYKNTPPQLKSLKDLSLKERPSAVFLTTGGNDIHFANIVKLCLVGPENCFLGNRFRERVLINAAAQKTDLENVYVEIAHSLDVLFPGKTPIPLIVSPYPNLLWDAKRGTCLNNAALNFSAEELRFGHKVLETLNNSIEGAVVGARAKGWPVYYADTVVDFAQPNHTLCATEKESYFNIPTGSAMFKGFSWAYPDESLTELAHPNAQGHEAWSQALVQWSLTGGAAPMTESELTRQAPPNKNWLLQKLSAAFRPTILAVQGTLDALADLDGEVSDGVQLLSARAGDAVDFYIENVLPDSLVTVRLHSTPRTIGSLIADENGVATGEVQLPLDIDSGVHTLALDGMDSDGSYAVLDLPVTLKAAIPVWMVVGGAVSVVALVAGVVLLTIGVVRRSRSKSARAS